MPAQLREVDSCLQSHGQGNVRVTLQQGRKNLLRLRVVSDQECSFTASSGGSMVL
jgi:hypothetical protein